MSVLIRGMDKIPEDGAVLIVKHDDNGKAYIKYAGMMGYSMELVKIPEKHGRLMDADAFLERFMSVDRTVSFGMSGLYVDIHDLYNILSSLPTVIEAEDGTCTM